MKKTLIVIAVISVILAVPFGIGANPRRDFEKANEKLQKFIAKEKYDEADELIEKFSAEYENNDAIKLLKMQLALNKGEVEQSIELANELSNRDNKRYYAVLYDAYNVGGDDYDSELLTLATGFARNNPGDAEYQFNAGMVCMASGQYDRSLYFFEKASSLMPYTGVPDYYCGIIAYELGDNDASASYFLSALNKGVDDVYSDSIKEYAAREVDHE